MQTEMVVKAVHQGGMRMVARCPVWGMVEPGTEVNSSFVLPGA